MVVLYSYNSFHIPQKKDVSTMHAMLYNYVHTALKIGYEKGLEYEK
jgi:hypothetical protein